jgi:aminoglycoside 3-N-acetyltransferase
MANTEIIKRIFGRLPLVEVLVRHVYWKNISFFSKYTSKGKEQTRVVSNNILSIDAVFMQWKEWGIIEGDLLIVTSSYTQLNRYQLEPEQIIDRMIEFLGPEGTLVMPAFPYYKNMPKNQYFLSKDIQSEVFRYDAAKNFVTTGILPGTLLKYKGAVRSSFPINSLGAYGKYAVEMFENEWSEKDPLPCGRGSAWAFAATKNAKIVSLGTDLTHSLTMIHVAEDSNNGWPIEGWYRNKKFILTGDVGTIEVTLRERDPKWGTLYFAERKLCDDLLRNNLMKTANIDGVLTEKIESVALLEFLSGRNQDGYPYYFIPRKYKKYQRL